MGMFPPREPIDRPGGVDDTLAAMRNTLLLSLAALALLLSPAAAQMGSGTGPEAGAPFRIVNRTGAEATQLFAVRSGRADWGGNLLKGPLAPEAAYTLRPAATAGWRLTINWASGSSRRAVASMSEKLCSLASP